MIHHGHESKQIQKFYVNTRKPKKKKKKLSVFAKKQIIQAKKKNSDGQ